MIARRTFIAGIGAAAVWPLAARGQQSALPVVGFVSAQPPERANTFGASFTKGLRENGYNGDIDGRNVTVESHWLDGHLEKFPDVTADLVGRRVAVIAIPGTALGALAAMAATSTIPIIFGVGDDPVKLGLVGSLSEEESTAVGTPA